MGFPHWLAMIYLPVGGGRRGMSKEPEALHGARGAGRGQLPREGDEH